MSKAVGKKHKRVGAALAARAGGGISASVEAHLAAYFEALGADLPAAGLYDRVLKEVEIPLLGLTLHLCKGNQIRAAALLGINRNTLRKKLRELGLIDEPTPRRPVTMKRTRRRKKS